MTHKPKPPPRLRLKSRQRWPVPNSIRNRRKESGLDQKDLAFLMGLKSTATLSRYENGLTTPGLENTFAMQFALGTPPHLLYRDLATRVAGEVRMRREQLPKSSNL